VMVVARSYPAGLVGLCQAVAQRLAGWSPALGLLLAPRQMED